MNSSIANAIMTRRQKSMNRTCFALAVCAACIWLAAANGQTPGWIARGKTMMVASDSYEASQVGLAILEDNGNAFDAAIAVSLALGVTRPQSTGIGGGGFLIGRMADGGRIVIVDYREIAPAQSDTAMYVRANAQHPGQPSASSVGYKAVATPGLIAGHAHVLKRFGSKKYAALAAPAIRLAEDGFSVDEHYVKACRTVAAKYEQHSSLKESCAYVYETHLRTGDLPKPGNKLVQPALGKLLRALAEDGPDAFYRGPIAESIARTMQQHGGIIDTSDLSGYRVADRREPVVTTYRDYKIIGMPPPSSGGACVAEILNILEALKWNQVHDKDPYLATHLLIESMKHAFADRSRWFGDTDFVPVPVGLLSSKAYAQTLAAQIDPQRTWPSERYGADQIPDDAGTSHYCIVDRWGNCVVATETINTEFGSLAAVDEWGLILNNEMDDFAAEPGMPNAFGLVQSARNAVAPGKRPLSSMSPMIVLKNDKPVLLLGASGGPRIITSVVQVLLGVVDLGYDLQHAMDAPRLHHQWMPNEVFTDRDLPDAHRQALTSRGHEFATKHREGVVQAIHIQPDGTLIGAADPRKGGQPAGR